MLVLQELIKREGEDFQTREGTLKDRVNLLYQRAAYDKKWTAVRRGAGMLKKLVDSLAPGITTILVSGKVVRNISNTRDPVSHHISKHQEDSLRYNAQRNIFDELRGFCKCIQRLP